MKLWSLLWVAAALLMPSLLMPSPRLLAQASDGILSQAEIEQLRDAAYVPTDRIKVYERILNDRERLINDLMKDRRHVTFGQDLHDLMDQFGQIADELNDNLDDYEKKHRDLRKVLPKLVQDTERWSTLLRTPADDDSYKIVKKIAVDAVKDTHDLATTMLADEEAYFKAHPEAAKAEKERRDNPHAPQ